MTTREMILDVTVGAAALLAFVFSIALILPN